MKVKYCCNSKDYENYYVTHIGKGIPYYSGRQFQRGYGLSGLFLSIGCAVLPMIKSGIKTVGKEVLRLGAEFALDALRGKNLKEAAIHRAKQSGVNLLERVAIPPPSGEPVHPPLKPRRKRQSTIKNLKNLQQDRKTFSVKWKVSFIRPLVKD